MAASSSKKTTVFIAVWVALVIAFVGGMIALYIVDSSQVSSAKIVDSGLIFDRMDVTVEWNDDRSCKITQDITAEFLTPSHGIYIDIPVNSGEKIRNLTVSAKTGSRSSGYKYERTGGFDLVRIRVGDEDVMLGSGSKMHCVVSYDYITPRHKDGGDILALMAIGTGWSSAIKSARVTITYPAAPVDANDTYGVWIAGEKATGLDYSWSHDGRTVTVNLPETRRENMYDEVMNVALRAYEGVEIAYKMPLGAMRDRVDLEFLLTLSIGGVLVLFAALLKFLLLKNKPLSPIVDFYPPRIDAQGGGKRRMLPVQMGKIIDDSCSDEDVTSLIFYWASEGYLDIDERDGETYLIKRKELDPVRGYEKELFDKIFVYGHAPAQTDMSAEPFEEFSEGKYGSTCPKCGKPTVGRYCGSCGCDLKTYASQAESGLIEVSLSELRGKLSPAILQCKSAVGREYRNKFYTHGSQVASNVMSVICAVFAVGISVLTSFRVAIPLFNLFGFLSLIPVILSAALGKYVAKNYFKLPDKKRKIMLAVCFILTAALAVLTALVIPPDVMGLGEKLLFAVTLSVPSCIAPFMLVREDGYNEELNSIIGFRDFLRDAEKDRLEALLADDPQYYYNILPYANVLGVSDIWEDKFKDLTIEPPTYYRSRVSVFDIYVISRLTRSVGSSMTYVPPSSSGSRSGGSFGGGGGGGFSGGSFGGGGGGRW